jgi:hypothetical protein
VPVFLFEIIDMRDPRGVVVILGHAGRAPICTICDSQSGRGILNRVMFCVA